MQNDGDDNLQALFASKRKSIPVKGKGSAKGSARKVAMWVEFRQDISTAMMGRKAWAAESLDKYWRNHRAPSTNSEYGDGLEASNS